MASGLGGSQTMTDAADPLPLCGWATQRLLP
jgi:hypothetical protein